MRVLIEGGALRTIILWPGRHLLTVDLRDRPAGTQLGMRCVQGTVFDPERQERPFKIKSVRYSPSRPKQPVSMKRWLPIYSAMRPGEQRAFNLDVAVQRYSARRFSIDDSQISPVAPGKMFRQAEPNPIEAAKPFIHNHCATFAVVRWVSAIWYLISFKPNYSVCRQSHG